ncbi:MAG TPA: NUDIX hydrolase [Ohtaekwangia sp.]
MSSEIGKIYGNKVRIRVCGLCWQDERLLMVNHNLDEGDFWAPPGGGVEFGETLEETLIREFEEETKLSVAVGKFQFGCEYIQDPIHSIELFYPVTRLKGKVETGTDPELPIIKKVTYLTYPEILNKPDRSLHGIFRHAQTIDQLKNLTGFYRI